MYSNKIRKTVLDLRQNKKSYSEIQKITGVPKGTLSEWLSAEDWSVKIKDELAEYHLKNYKPNLVKALEVMAKNKKERYDGYRQEAQEEFIHLKNNPLFSYGLGIYWGEGNKKSSWRVGVINTDPNIMKIVAKFFREILKSDEKKLRVALFLYEDVDEQNAKTFWSDLLQIPSKQFIKIQVLESRAKLTKTKSKYGICSLYFSNTRIHTKILEWIRLLSLDLAGLA